LVGDEGDQVVDLLAGDVVTRPIDGASMVRIQSSTSSVAAFATWGWGLPIGFPALGNQAYPPASGIRALTEATTSSSGSRSVSRRYRCVSS